MIYSRNISERYVLFTSLCIQWYWDVSQTVFRKTLGVYEESKLQIGNVILRTVTYLLQLEI
jgi:hypothetical protein